MSISIMAECWPLKIPPTAKFVLLAIAEHADDQGKAWPSIGRLTEHTCFGRSAVIEAIKLLESCGVLKADRTDRYRTRYRVSPEKFNGEELVRQTDYSVKQTSPNERKLVRLADNEVRLPDNEVREVDTNHQEPSLIVTKSNRQTRTREKVIPEGFDQFWKTYPRKDSKQDAIRAWGKISEIDRMDVASILPRWVRSWTWVHEPKFIPHGATWLNKRRWEDPPPPLDAERAAPSKTRQLIDDLMESSHGYDRNPAALAGPAADPWDDDPDGTVVATIPGY